MGLFQQFFGARPYLPTQQLPTSGWCQAVGIMRMSLVWPWYATESGGLVDSYGREVGVAPAVELHAPRSDREASLIVWCDPSGGVTEVPPNWANAVARMYRGPVQTNTAIALDRLPGRMLRVANGVDTHWRIVIPRGQNVVQVEACLPTTHAEAYWVQVESMLATWSWD